MSIDYVAAGDDHIVTITINRPARRRNSMDMEQHFFGLRSAWDPLRRRRRRLRRHRDRRPGRTSASAPTSRRTSPRSPSLQSKMERTAPDLRSWAVTDSMTASGRCMRGTKLYKPIIAAVNGTCVAGGMEMLGGTDLRVASEHGHHFAVMEPKSGLFAERRHHREGCPARSPTRRPWDSCSAPTRFRRSGPMKWACSTRSTRPADLMDQRARLRRPHHGQRGPWPSARRRSRCCAGWPPI